MATKTTDPTTPSRKPLSDYADAKVTPLIQEYCDWLTENTGVKVDPPSVYLGSALRARFQQERREAKASPKPVRRRAPRKTKEQSA